MAMHTQQSKPAAKSAGQGEMASGQASAEQIIQQYKNSFMRRQNKVGTPLMHGVNQPAIQMKEVIQLVPDYNARPELQGSFSLAEQRQDNITGNMKRRFLALKNCEENIVRPALTGAGVHYRYGGSFAAFFQGAQRLPGDVDVEVEQPDDVRIAGGAVHHNGTTVGNPLFHQGLCACVTKDVPYTCIHEPFQNAHNLTMPISVDISNEASPQFSQNVKSPAERGSVFGSGDLVSRIELIMNYLDRMSRKGNNKNDHLQIADLIISAGMAGDQNLKPILHQHIDMHIKNTQDQYKMLIDRIIDNANAASYNKSPQPRPE